MAQARINDAALARELARRLDSGESAPREGDSPAVQGLLQTFACLQTIRAEPDPAFERQLYRTVARRAQPALPRLTTRLSGGFSWLRRRPLLATAAILLLAVIVGQAFYSGPGAGQPLVYIPRDWSQAGVETEVHRYGLNRPWWAGGWSRAPVAVNEYWPSGTAAMLDLYSPDFTQPPDRMVTQQAFLVLSVEDQSASLAALKEIIQAQHGFIVDSESTLTTRDYSNVVVQFRVPAAAFEETIAQVEALRGLVVSERLTSSDVTSSYVDLEARLHNLELTETELQDLLQAAQERGDTAADILSINKTLSDIRGQIEQLRGEKNLLEESVAMAQIQVVLAPKEAVPGFNAGQLFGDAWARLGRFLQRVAALLIYGLVFLLPLLPIIGVVVLIRRARSRKGASN